MNFGFVLIALAALTSQAAAVSEISQLAQQLAEACKRGNRNEIAKFYHDDAVLTFRSRLPFGGTYQGKQVIQFYDRLDRTIDITDMKLEKIGEDQGKGIVMMQATITGTFKKTGRPVQLKLICITEWDVAAKKIMHNIVFNRDVMQTLNAYSTRAEKNLEALMWSFFRSNYEDIVSGQAEVWNRISDQIQVKVDVYPPNAIDRTGKTTWNGKNELMQAYKEWTGDEKLMSIFRKMVHHLYMLDMKVIFSTENEVWAKFGVPGTNYIKMVHYTFDDQDLLVEEEVLMGSLRPWQVLPFPLPPTQGVLDRKQESWSNPAIKMP